MKKLITKYWGIVLVVVLISSLFVSATPVAAGNWAMTNSLGLPETVVLGTTVIAPADGFVLLDAAQSGSTIYATATDNVGLDYLYKSADGGASWTRVLSANTWIAAGNWNLVAVAPDDPNIVVVVDTAPAFADVVYLSTTGGALFSALTATTANLNTVAISPTNGFARYITIGGNTIAPAANSKGGYLRTWTMGAVAPAWTAPVGFAPVSGNTSVPAGATSNVTIDDIEDVAFSPNFLADQALLFITESVGGGIEVGECALHVYSFNTFNYDAAIDVSFPRVLETSAIGVALTVARAEMALDANFFLADEPAQIGFIGADITTPAVQAGGVYRIGTYTVAAGVETLTQIMTGTAIRSVAWDGTNLMAVQNATNNIWRSSTALGVVPAFLQNSTLKAPSVGAVAEVIFNNGAALAFSGGASAGIARSSDLGKSWNGYALMAGDAYRMVLDIWVSADATVKYFIADDGTDTSVWRQNGRVTERIMLLAATTGQNWLVRADAENTANVYIGRAGATNMYKSTDSGDTIWTARSAPAAIADFAVQDANTVYVGAGVFVYKSTNGAFTWGIPTAVPFVTGGGAVFSLNLIADDNLLIGGTTGGAAYTADGGATYVGLGGLFNLFGTNVVLTADNLAAGGNVYAVCSSAVFGGVSRWTIGTSFAWTGGQAMLGAGRMGVVLANGVLYAADNNAGLVYRILNPATDITAATGATSSAETGNYTRGVNPLSASVAGTTVTLYALNNVSGPLAVRPLDTLESYNDALTSSTNAPALVYPVNNQKIDINSISGAVATFTFQWSAPAVVTVPATAYNYDLQVFLDEAGTVPVTAVYLTPTTSLAASLSVASGIGGVGFAGVPGETYYWRVRVTGIAAAAGVVNAADTNVNSAYSPMAMFTVQQLTAVVPTLASPANGATLPAGTTPAFSWSPISGAATYSFEVSTDPDFATTVYSTTTNTAGAMVPSSVTMTAGTTYFWRVKALTPTEGEWSTVGNFVVAEPVVTTPPTSQPVITPTITVELPTPTVTTVTVVPPPTTNETVNPTYIWAIIIIGAVLVIAVIVLIVRTRRSV